MEIYEPAEDSYLLQRFVKEYAYGRVLDMGAGSGIQALTAVKNLNVKEVVAVDINEKAITNLKDKSIRNLKVIKSDLFDKVEGSFNTIIFNPPYLPQDKGIEDMALYGGKKGWEISDKFFSQVSKFLFSDGKILFLFSSLTNKKKIINIIENNLFEFKEVGKEKLAFEELYVYLVKKTSLLRKLESKLIENISYFSHGKRGNIFTGILDKSKLIKTHLISKKELVKVGIKIKREESEAKDRIVNEAKWLRILNKKRIGPKLLFSDQDYLVYEFVEGEHVLDWLEHSNKESIVNVLINILKQCYELDQLKVNKEEMHHPLKHIIVDKYNIPVLIDFERCYQTEKPHNVTQFVEFICRIEKELKDKGININIQNLRNTAKVYKNNQDLNLIIKQLN